MGDRNLDLVRLTVERELDRVRGEVAESKADLEKFKADLVQQVADAKVQIGEKAIEKMSRVFAEFRSWAVLCAALVFAGGGFGFYQLYTGAGKIIESKINDWLSFEKKGALLKESLESIRMRVVLDSLVTRMERSGWTEYFGHRFDVSAAEKSRLVAYMLQEDTSEMDFRDGARVLAAHFGLFFPAMDTQLNELLSKTMARFQVDNYRPVVLFEAFKRYQGIAHYAEQVLEKPNIPVQLRTAAFKALAVVSSEDAQKYAKGNLLKEEYSPLRDALALSLAGEQGATHLVDRWIDKKTEEGEGVDARVMLADSLAARISPMNFKPDEQKWLINRSAALLVDAIGKGAKLTFRENMSGADLAFRTDRDSASRQADNIFDKLEALLPALTKAASVAEIPADEFIRALTTTGARGQIFGLKIIIASTSLVGHEFGVIGNSSVAGSVLVVSDDRAIDPTIQVSFRAKDGSWVSDKAKSLGDLYGGKIIPAYDEIVLQAIRLNDLRRLRYE
ncbi:hypothetical protein D3C86_719920 [compost metagenome]